MRRIASGCTTESHPLYPAFMSLLSTCIFVWDPEDLAKLFKAKTEELARSGHIDMSNFQVEKQVSK